MKDESLNEFLMHPEKIDVVIPVLNEASHLAFCLEKIQAVLLREVREHRIILVDDGSTDSTWSVISELCAKDNQISGVRLSRNFGKEAALAAGLSLSTAEATVTMDVDLQHPPQIIAQMLSTRRETRANIVHARKFSRGKESFFRKFTARIYYWMISYASGLNLRGATDFKLMDRQAVEAYLKLCEINVFYRGMVAWLGFRQETVDFEVETRVGGASNWTIWQLVKLAVSSTLAFSTGPLYGILVLGVIFCILAVIIVIKMLIDYYFRSINTAGVPTIIAISLLIGGLTLISLSIIGLYIAKIYEEVKRRPRFLIDERLG